MRFIAIFIIVFALASCNYFDNKAIGIIKFGISNEEFQIQKKLFLSDKKLDDSVYSLNGYLFKDIEGDFYKNQLYRIQIKHIPLKYNLHVNPAHYVSGKKNESLEYSSISGNFEIIQDLILAFNKKYSAEELDMYHEYKYPDVNNQVRLGEWNNYFKNIVLYRINIPENLYPGHDIKENIYDNYRIGGVEFSLIKRELIDTSKIYIFDSHNLVITYNPIISEIEKDSYNDFNSKIDSLSKDL